MGINVLPSRPPAAVRCVRHFWTDDLGQVLAMFGTEACAQFVFDTLTDEQMREFLRATEGNMFNRKDACIECGTDLFAGNKVCSNCGLDNEDK